MAKSSLDPFGDRLRRARHNHDPSLTQLDVANALGVRQSTVSSWESGHARPNNLVTIARLAEVLAIDVSELVNAAVTADSTAE